MKPKIIEDKREAILEATLRLVSKSGFHGTAMASVAKQAGVSAGVIYYYFESKDALIDELYKTVKHNAVKAIMAKHDPKQPLKLQIKGLLGNLFRYYVKNPREVAFMEQYSKSPYHRAEIEDAVSQDFTTIIESFERAKKEMIIKDLPQAVLATLTLDVASSLAQKQTAGLIDLSDKQIEQVIDATWEAIRR